MASEDSAEKICRRMDELRRDLTGDVREVGRTARVMTDWRFYVSRFPWAMVGLAAIAGYMLIPRKKQFITPDQNALAEMVRKKQLRLDVEHKNEKQGMLKSLLLMGLTWAAKTGMGYMGERMRTNARSKTHDTPHPAPAPSPLQEPWKTTPR